MGVVWSDCCCRPALQKCAEEELLGLPEYSPVELDDFHTSRSRLSTPGGECRDSSEDLGSAAAESSSFRTIEGVVFRSSEDDGSLFSNLLLNQVPTEHRQDDSQPPLEFSLIDFSLTEIPATGNASVTEKAARTRRGRAPPSEAGPEAPPEAAQTEPCEATRDEVCATAAGDNQPQPRERVARVATMNAPNTQVVAAASSPASRREPSGSERRVVIPPSRPVTEASVLAAFRTLGVKRANEMGPVVLRVWKHWYANSGSKFYPKTSSILTNAPNRPWWLVGVQPSGALPSPLPSLEELLWLYRFCVARSGDETAATRLLIQDLEWRELHHSRNPRVTVDLPTLFKAYPHGYFGTTRDGLPVYYDRVGRLKARDLLQKFGTDAVVQYWIAAYETLQNVILPACSLMVGQRIYQSVSVLDLDGVSVNEFARGRELVTRLVEVAQNHYPEIMAKTYIIRPSLLFKGVWAVIKPLLSKETLTKVSLVDSGREVEVLEKLISRNAMPTFVFDRKCEDLGWCMGGGQDPWRDPMILAKLQKIFNDTATSCLLNKLAATTDTE